MHDWKLWYTKYVNLNKVLEGGRERERKRNRERERERKREREKEREIES